MTVILSFNGRLEDVNTRIRVWTRSAFERGEAIEIVDREGRYLGDATCLGPVMITGIGGERVKALQLELQKWKAYHFTIIRSSTRRKTYEE